MAALGIAVGLMAGGCELGLLDGVEVENQTSMELRFEVIRADGMAHRLNARAMPGGTALLITPGADRLLRDGCTVGDLIAYGPGAVEVARRAPPICINERWIIGPLPSPPASGR
jgi:hypothetical protein